LGNNFGYRYNNEVRIGDRNDSTKMRNTLEPQEIFVEIDIPVKADYFANAEAILKEQIGVDVKESTEPILSPDGMKYALEQLSLQVVAEPLSDEEWDEATEEDDSWDEDEPVKEEKDNEDWDSEDLDWDEE
jgi:hypothetical protein